MRHSSPRFAHAVIVAEAVFGERSIDLIGEPQWIVAVILGTGHSCIRSRSGLSPSYSALVIRVSALRLVNVNFVISNKRGCDFLDDNCHFRVAMVKNWRQ
jgi:hypothetical protein